MGNNDLHHHLRNLTNSNLQSTGHRELIHANPHLWNQSIHESGINTSVPAIFKFSLHQNHNPSIHSSNTLSKLPALRQRQLHLASCPRQIFLYCCIRPSPNEIIPVRQLRRFRPSSVQFPTDRGSSGVGCSHRRSTTTSLPSTRIFTQTSTVIHHSPSQLVHADPYIYSVSSISHSIDTRLPVLHPISLPSEMT
jgi:hypothetical protein